MMHFKVIEFLCKLNLMLIIWNSRITWVFLVGFGIYYGYLLYSPVLDNWYNNPVVHDIDRPDFYVKEIPFPAVTICSNNMIVYRQLESVLLTQPWKGLNKSIKNFENDFNSALTALVVGQDNPKMLRKLSKGAIGILNQYQNQLPDILKRVFYANIFSTYWQFLINFYIDPL